jgi:hypothetical protein
VSPIKSAFRTKTLNHNILIGVITFRFSPLDRASTPKGESNTSAI